MEACFSWSLSSSLRPSLAHLDHSHAWSAMTWLRPDTLPPRHHLCPFTPASHSAGVLSLRAPRTRYRMYLEYLDVLLCVAFRAALDIGIHTCMSLPCTGSSAPRVRGRAITSNEAPSPSPLLKPKGHGISPVRTEHLSVGW